MILFIDDDTDFIDLIQSFMETEYPEFQIKYFSNPEELINFSKDLESF